MSVRRSRDGRHTTILHLLRDRAIASQGDLAEALAEEGYRVTQSTLSRDLKELRVVRLATGDGYRYVPGAGGEGAPRSRVADGEVLRVAANETLVVVRTQIGRASGVAAFLDSRRPPGVLATLAGDDTILVVPTRVEETADLARRLRRFPM